MHQVIEYLCANYVVSEDRAKELCTKHQVPAEMSEIDAITAGEVIAEEEALDPQVWMEDEDFAMETPDV